jgi:hypothetical protein
LIGNAVQFMRIAIGEVEQKLPERSAAADPGRPEALTALH